MSDYTVVNAAGQIVMLLDVPDAETLALNTPAGMTAIAGRPPLIVSTWNAATQEWVTP